MDVMDTTVARVSFLVPPGEARLALSTGHTLIVKKKLNAGETFDLFERGAPGLDVTEPDAIRKIPPATLGMALVSAYLLDWDLTDLDGAIIPMRGLSVEDKEATVRLLEFETAIDLITAITAHDAATRQEKKRRSSVSAS